MRRFRARRKAAGLKTVARWVQGNEALPVYSSHRLHDARSLAMHTAIASKIDRDPTLLEKAHDNLRRWRDRQGDSVAPWLVEWQKLLRRPWREVAGIITGLTEESARLRQSSPFAGVLDVAQRRRIHAAFRP
jgi:hypothetical protein